MDDKSVDRFSIFRGFFTVGISPKKAVNLQMCFVFDSQFGRKESGPHQILPTTLLS